MANKSISKFNVAVVQQSGKVGTVRYYQKGGETYVRTAHNSVVTNPRSDKQMVQRLQFASRAALWSAMKGNLKNGFTNKLGRQSDFNAFMQLNQGEGVYFTKKQMQKLAQVIFPIQITDGRLESIIAEKVDGRIKSNIALGSLVLGADTTVHQFAQAVVANNDGFEYGDEIAFVSILQTVNGENIPKIKGNFYRIVLTKGDDRLVHGMVTADGFQTISGYLGTNADMPAGCFAYVHTRRDSSLMVSAQTLVNNNETIIGTYSSDEQYALAAESYEKGEDLFLDPNSGAATTSETVLYDVLLSYAEGSTSAMGNLTGSGSYEKGASAVITATPKAGYRFVKWSDDNTSASRTLTVNANVSLSATFEAIPGITVTLTADPSNGGTVQIDDETAGATCSKTVEAGTQVTIKAVADTDMGYQFVEWSDHNESATRTLTVNEAKSLTASFESA